MNKCLTYSIVIYLIFTMSVILHKPQILCDHTGAFKSWNYLKNNLQYGINDPQELISLPVIFIGLSLVAYGLAKHLEKS